MEGIENICKRIGQRWEVDLTKIKYVADCDESDMKRYERLGHHILIMFDGVKRNVYITKHTDGLLREPCDVWTRECKIFPYETNQKVWERNVRWWFSEAKKNNDYIDDLLSLFPSADALKVMDDACNLLCSFEVKNYGGRKGQRTSDIDGFLMEHF